MSKIGAATAFFRFRGYFTKIWGGKLIKTSFFLLIKSFFTFVTAVYCLLMLDDLTECGLMPQRKRKTIFSIFRYNFYQFFPKLVQFC